MMKGGDRPLNWGVFNYAPILVPVCALLASNNRALAATMIFLLRYFIGELAAILEDTGIGKMH